MTCGVDDDRQTLIDAWLLDIPFRKWIEVRDVVTVILTVLGCDEVYTSTSTKLLYNKLSVFTFAIVYIYIYSGIVRIQRNKYIAS